MVRRKPIIPGRNHENEEKEGQPGDDMLMERIERFFEEMSERDHDENRPKSQEAWADPKADQQESSGNELDDRNRYTGCP